jgi:hypothetical protein
MQMTKHAEVRCQQRNVQPLIRQWLLDYGAEVRTPEGALKSYFDHESRRRLAAEFGAKVVDRMGDLLNGYLVENGQTVITAAVRQRRFRRP